VSRRIASHEITEPLVSGPSGLDIHKLFVGCMLVESRVRGCRRVDVGETEKIGRAEPRRGSLSRRWFAATARTSRREPDPDHRRGHDDRPWRGWNILGLPCLGGNHFSRISTPTMEFLPIGPPLNVSRGLAKHWGAGMNVHHKRVVIVGISIFLGIGVFLNALIRCNDCDALNQQN